MPYFRDILCDELAERTARNGRYSLRAFAQSLGVDPGNLSRSMRGASGLSWSYAQRIAGALDLTGDETKRFFESVAQYSGRRKTERQGGKRASGKVLAIDPERFAVVADVLHYAILELTAVEGFRPDSRSIAKALGAGKMQDDLAIQRLLDVGLLKRVGRRLVKVAAKVSTPGGLATSIALRRHMKQVLQKGIESVDRDPIEKRCHVTLTMPIDPAKLEEARRAIETFSQSLCDRLTSGKRLQVYQLGICLYPLQQESTYAEN